MTKTNYILPAIAVAIFNEKDEILLQKRRDTNQWCVICGHVEYGESVEDAAIREIQEETGVDAIITRLIGIYSNPISQTYYYSDKNIQYITSYFEAKLKSDIDLSFTNGETVELKYFHPDDLPDNMGQLNENWLKDALCKRETSFIR